ncbi:helix-turn-helix domain-containing protein [Aerococcus viridans]|uniref:helix-turn-helix domain-containing protein n=1 Tax=Aerococcus viridans TaxID=1377 RepID=UPI00223BEB43|nr:helix-turn-helix domain-containing protein [Aerococcus viridans]MCT1797258.1 helix-turn-helix domain-containing protein [Aerococcus viridans]
MRELLTNKQRREIEVLEFLTHIGTPQQVKDIATYANISNRMVMETIRNINDNYDFIDIFKVDDLYGIQYKNNTSIDNLYRAVYNSNTYFTIVQYIFFHDKATLGELSNILFVSESTTYRSILKINKVLTEKYGFSIDSDPYQFSGDELNIRLFMQRFFIESSDILHWPFPDHDRNFYQNLLLHMASYTPYKLDIYSLHSLSISVIVNEIRYEYGHKHPLPITRLQDSLSEAIVIYDFDLDELNKKFDLDFDKEYIEQILGLFIEQDFKYDYAEIEALRSSDEHIGNILNYLEETLDRLIHKFKVPLPNREALLLELYNIILIEGQTVSKPFILRDHFLEHNQIIRNYNPAFYDAVFEGMQNYCKLVFGDNYNPHVLYATVYSVLNYWEDLFNNLTNKMPAANILVLAKITWEGSKQAANIIKAIFGPRVKVETWDNLDISIPLLAESPYDIICSSFSIPSIPGKEIYTITSESYQYNFQSLENIINRVRYQKFKQEMASDE